MTSIAITLDLGQGYSCESGMVSIPGGCQTFDFVPKAGKHRFESAPMAIGTLPKVEGRRLMAMISFGYEYDADTAIISLSGPDHVSSRTMHLETWPEGTDEVCKQRISGHGYRHDDLAGNPHWNYLGPLTPGLEGYLAGVLQGTLLGLIAALKSAPDLSVEVRGAPPKLPLDDYLKLMVVKREGKFLGFFDKTQTYPDGCSYIGVESTYVGTVTWVNGFDFANVIGSTDDPKVPNYTSWIKLWAAKCNHGVKANGVCTSTGYPGTVTCSNKIVGGHVIPGTHASRMNKGDRVYIIPICKPHNNTDATSMKAFNWHDAVSLNYW